MEDRRFLLTPRQVAEQTGMTVPGLAQLRFKGTGPLFVKLSPKVVRYRQSDIDAWIDASVRSRTDERSAPKAG